MKDVLGIILGGGEGKRLFPLTKYRSKPAVPFGGKYRLVDIPISNCINSGINKIFVCTQFNSESLNRHINQSYKFDYFHQGFVDILAAEQTLNNRSWYQGTADAVRKNLVHFRNYPQAGDFLILSGDQLYRMDFQEMITQHRSRGAEVTIAAVPVPVQRCGEFGIMKLDDSGRILDFLEKPVPDDRIKEFLIDTGNGHVLASMGIYVFKRGVLKDLLADASLTDFGAHIIPRALEERKTCGYIYGGYWEDVGTIRTFYEANIDLTRITPRFNFYEEWAPVYTHPRYLPTSKINACRLEEAILAEGCIIDRAQIRQSIIGVRSVIQEGARVRRSVVMGADFYETEEEKQENRNRCIPDVGIGGDSLISGAIIDKNARIGRGVKICNQDNLTEFDGEGYTIREGIVVVEKGAVIPDGTRI